MSKIHKMTTVSSQNGHGWKKSCILSEFAQLVAIIKKDFNLEKNKMIQQPIEAD